MSFRVGETAGAAGGGAVKHDEKSPAHEVSSYERQGYLSA
jgi:hypothetical protein